MGFVAQTTRIDVAVFDVNRRNLRSMRSARLPVSIELMIFSQTQSARRESSLSLARRLKLLSIKEKPCAISSPRPLSQI